MCWHEYLAVRQNFKEELDSQNIRFPLVPKHIWMFHYSRLTQLCGSVAHLNTQIGEQKNAIIKSHSQRAKQTKNVLHTIAKTEKVLSSIRVCKDKEISPFSNFCRTELDILPECLKTDITNHCFSRGLLQTDFVYYKRVQLFGFKFRAGNNSCICYNDPRRPLFGLIHTIAREAEGNRLFFIVENLTRTLVPNLDLLVLEKMGTYQWVEPRDLVLGHPINIYPMSNYLDEEKLYCENCYVNI